MAEPDVLEHLDALRAEGVADVVVAPVGFVSDHMEVVYDLDMEARERAAALGLGFVRAGTAGTHPAFVRMIRELIVERVARGERQGLGVTGAAPGRLRPRLLPVGRHAPAPRVEPPTVAAYPGVGCATSARRVRVRPRVGERPLALRRAPARWARIAARRSASGISRRSAGRWP